MGDAYSNARKEEERMEAYVESHGWKPTERIGQWGPRAWIDPMDPSADPLWADDAYDVQRSRMEAVRTVMER